MNVKSLMRKRRNHRASRKTYMENMKRGGKHKKSDDGVFPKMNNGERK